MEDDPATARLQGHREATEPILEHGLRERQLADGARPHSDVEDQFTRECVGLEADRSATRIKVAQALERARQERGSCRRALRSRILQSGHWKPGPRAPMYSSVSFGQAARWRTDSSKDSMAGCTTGVLRVEWFAWLGDARRKLRQQRQKRLTMPRTSPLLLQKLGAV